jgi:hypothetical protein
MRFDYLAADDGVIAQHRRRAVVRPREILKLRFSRSQAIIHGEFFSSSSAA